MGLEVGTKFLLLNGTECLASCESLLHEMLQKFLDRAAAQANSLYERARVTIVRAPDHENLVDVVSIDVRRLEGHSAMLHPLVLDDCLQAIPDPDDPSTFARDLSQPKQLLPVEFPCRVVTQRPQMVELNKKLNNEGLAKELAISGVAWCDVV